MVISPFEAQDAHLSVTRLPIEWKPIQLIRVRLLVPAATDGWEVHASSRTKDAGAHVRAAGHAQVCLLARAERFRVP